LLTQEPEVIVRADMKIYESGGYKFAIAQVETTDLYQIGDFMPRLTQALIGLKKEHGLDFAGLMITDVVEGSSRLLFVDAPPALEELPYEPLPDGTELADGVVSRKKQLLPILLSLLEE
jgi:manganese-dependent inorganic pyrophosphatase